MKWYVYTYGSLQKNNIRISLVFLTTVLVTYNLRLGFYLTEIQLCALVKVIID